MRIGVLGTGQVGRAIAGHWASTGHDVLFGNRAGEWRDDQPLPDGARIGTLADAAHHGEVVLMALPWGAVEAVMTGPVGTALSGRILLDCSNSLSPVDHHGALPDLSGAEQIAAWSPGARVVKIFNTAGIETLARPDYAGTAATMFFATDDAAAATLAAGLAAECGFDPVHAGGLAVARDLEALTRFWGKLAFGRGMGRRIAFHLLRDR